MKLTSAAFADDEQMPPQYTCDGAGISPPLTISDVPEGTQSLVLIMDDPDVPASIRPDGMWDHWIVFNMPPTVTEIAEGTEPPGTHGTGTANNQNYHGPCPPDDEHRYRFKLYALDQKLELPAGSSKTDVEAAMKKHSIAETVLVGRYSR